jgi:hypothetical protein
MRDTPRSVLPIGVNDLPSSDFEQPIKGEVEPWAHD